MIRDMRILLTVLVTMLLPTATAANGIDTQTYRWLLKGLLHSIIIENPADAFPIDWHIRCVGEVGPLVDVGGDGPLILVLGIRVPENHGIRNHLTLRLPYSDAIGELHVGGVRHHAVDSTSPHRSRSFPISAIRHHRHSEAVSSDRRMVRTSPPVRPSGMSGCSSPFLPISPVKTATMTMFGGHFANS